MIDKNYFWIINLIGVSLISYFLADIAGQVIFNRILQYDPSSVSYKAGTNVSSVPKANSGIQYPLSHYNLISNKNIFRRGSELVEEQPVEDKADITVDDSLAPTQSKLDLRLVGTTLKGGKGYMAFLEDKKSKKHKEYWIGDLIRLDTKLIDIKRESIIIERNGRREIIEYLPSEKSKKGGASKRNNSMQSSGGVTSISERNWVLDRRYIDKELNDLSTLITQIRAVPSGKKGFKVFNIKKRSLFDKIGLKNGDLVKRINGVELSSPDKAIEMYQQLQGTSEIQIDIMRGGVTHTYNYSIQ